MAALAAVLSGGPGPCHLAATAGTINSSVGVATPAGPQSMCPPMPAALAAAEGQMPESSDRLAGSSEDTGGVLETHPLNVPHMPRPDSGSGSAKRQMDASG